jgi:hypothetical protein
MKKLILFSILLSTAYTLRAQTYSGRNDQKIQVGFTFYGYGTGIKATYDYGLNDNFSVGGGANFFNSGEYSSGFFIFGRGDYHFANALDAPDELDLYLGAEIGLIGNSNFGIGGHLGARYGFSNALAAFIEIGSNGAVGIAINL